MRKISDSEYREYREYKKDKLNGRILTPDGLRFICEAEGRDPEKIGKLILDALARFEAESTSRGRDVMTNGDYIRNLDNHRLAGALAGKAAPMSELEKHIPDCKGCPEGAPWYCFSCVRTIESWLSAERGRPNG